MKVLASCFAHAVSLATKAFLSALSPKGTSSVDLEGGDEADTQHDENNETEEEMQQVLKQIQDAINEVDKGSDEAAYLKSLLIKIRGFIAKVTFLSLFFKVY